MNYFTSNGFFGDAIAHRAKYGTADSTSSEKGTDNKKNNTSEYNHEYYMKNKEKWEDNDSNKDSSSKESDDKEFDIDAAAMDVIRGKYKNGDERKKILGDDYEMIQKRVNELMKQMKKSEESKENSSASSSSSSESKEKSKWDQIVEKYTGDGSSEEDKKKKAEAAAKAAQEKGKTQTEYYKKKNIKHSDFEDIGSILVRDLL